MGAGEIVGLLGPNGAGKTTTISCIAGLLRPDSGSVSICGVDAVKQGPAARLHLGIATQEVGLYLPLDAEQNLRFYAALAGVKKKQIDSCVSQTIERFGLGDLRGKAVGSLSAGQKRLVHVASAVVGAPSVLLLDEMTANLDVTVRHLLMESVREIAQEGCAILYSSHYLEEVEDLCSRVVILDRGAVIASGGIADLIGKHGGGCVEMVVDGQVLVAETMDLSEAIQSVGPTQRLQSARVIDSSLEAVFISLTGEPSQALFPERQEKARC